MQVLCALAAEPARWRHGYDLGAETGLKAGSLYPILIRLADRGLLEAAWEDSVPQGRPPRHLYRLTPGGPGAGRRPAAPAPAARTRARVALRPQPDGAMAWRALAGAMAARGGSAAERPLAGRHDREADFLGRRGEPLVVGDERGQARPQRHRRRQVDRVKGAQERLLDGGRPA